MKRVRTRNIFFNFALNDDSIQHLNANWILPWLRATGKQLVNRQLSHSEFSRHFVCHSLFSTLSQYQKSGKKISVYKNANKILLTKKNGKNFVGPVFIFMVSRILIMLYVLPLQPSCFALPIVRMTIDDLSESYVNKTDNKNLRVSISRQLQIMPCQYFSSTIATAVGLK